MVTTHEVNDLIGQGGKVVGEGGEKLGSVGQLYLDDQSGEPEFVTVKTGLLGTGESFVPLHEARIQGDEIHVPYSKDFVKDAPHIDDSDGHLSQERENDLFRYYGIGAAGGAANGGPQGAPVGDLTGTDGDRETTGHDVSGPETDGAMTRSEERLDVGKEKVDTGRARLRKYVVTEDVTTTVPVSREEVRVEREPITDANRGDALSGGDITEEEHEVQLSEERVRVEKESVPVERVRMDKQTVTEDQQVTDEVRKEQIEADVPESDSRR